MLNISSTSASLFTLYRTAQKIPLISIALRSRAIRRSDSNWRRDNQSLEKSNEEKELHTVVQISHEERVALLRDISRQRRNFCRNMWITWPYPFD